MKEQIKRFISTKQFNMCMLGLIIFIIIFSVFVEIMKYNIDGEQDVPFSISKISAISTIEGYDVEDNQNKWNLKAEQNNDIYIYIDKNKEYDKQETIKNIKLSNFVVDKAPNKGTLELLKPDNKTENVIFRNIDDDIVNEIEYTGDINSDIKNMKIANQGGLIVFRYAIKNLGNYISNDSEEIEHSKLLEKLKVNNEDLKFHFSFDITINLDSGKKYITNIDINLPIGDVVNNGTQSEEKLNIENLKFKRI